MNKRFHLMCRGLMLSLLAALLTACATSQYDCQKRGSTVQIIGESAQPGSVAINGPVFNRIAASLAANLTGEGYRVVHADRLMEAYPEYFKRDSIQHKDGTLIDLVRSMKGPKVDVVAVVSIDAATQAMAYHTNVSSGLDVRLLDVGNGKALGTFALDSDQKTSVRPGCKAGCLADAVVDNAKPMTLEAATVIADKLDCKGGGSAGDFDHSHGGFSTAYTVIVDGFTVKEVMALEEQLAALGGYESHRVIYAGARRSEWWYQTSMKSAVLNRNIQTMLKTAGLRGVVQFSGNTYTVKKITLRGSGGHSEGSTRKPINREDW